jgi:two-component system LytT family response regulator
MKVRAAIVEDEPLARRTLRELIGGVDWLELIGEAADGRAAVALIDDLKPDLVFLDVRMPELTGIEVLGRIEHQPAVVFTTAFDRYAVAAFELEAIDYLIKPFGKKRFGSTLERVRRRLEATEQEPAGVPSARERARAALDGRGPLKRLFARKGSRIVPLRMDAVSRIEACDDYSEVYYRGETYLVHLRLQELEKRLDGEKFLRVHRSHVINLDHVEQLEPYDDRRLEVRLIDGSRVVASRAGSGKLKDMIG